jgi:hypothetical protein
MSRGVERRWVDWLDSSTWRRIAKSAPGARVLRSRAFHVVDTRRRYAESSIRTARHPMRFASVRTCCLFLGTVKSGGSLVGSLLDAHPRAVVSDEADPLRYLDAGFGREQIFDLLAKAARREAMKGRVTARRLEPYSLAVPGQHQGVVSAPLVIGDSRAGPTTRRLGEHLDMIDGWRTLLGDVDDRYIHVVRNPYDPIAAMVRRGGRTFENAIEDYAAQCRRVMTLRRHLTPRHVLTVRYEDMRAVPSDQLRAVCRFLGLEARADYLTACAGIIDASRTAERHTVNWHSDAVAAVERLTVEFPFLQGYVYAD